MSDMPLALARRLRANVTSLDDLRLLALVAAVMAVMPLVIRLRLPRVLGWLDTASRRVSVRDPNRVARVVKYCRGMGRWRIWGFQDNCVARSLTLFVLLNDPVAPVDVVFGVRAHAAANGGITPGRRHVWLERDGQPLFETEPIDQYVVSTRYRAGSRADAGRVAGGGAERGLMWSATLAGGLATTVALGAGAARAKIVALLLGPTAIGWLGQQSTIAALLSYLSSFGTAGGTTRFLSEAVAAGDGRRAGSVVRTSILVQLTASAAVAIGLGVFATPLTSLLFGRVAEAQWLAWLLPAVPLTAVAAVGASVLRGHRLAVRHAVAQAGAAFTGIAVVAAMSARRDPLAVVTFPALLAGALALAMTAAAWPPLAAAWRSAPHGVDRGLARQILSYGAANVVMAACTAAATVVVGRLLLSHAAGTAAGHFYALSAGADALLTLVLGGYQAHYYPTFCAVSAQPVAGAVLGRLVRTATCFTVPVLAGTVLLAPWAVPLLLSDQFRAIVPLVGMLAVGVYLRMLSTMLGIPLLARGHLVLVVGLHAAWSALVIAAFAWRGSAGGASSWVWAFAAAAGAHALVLLAVVSGRIRVRLDAGTLGVIVAGGLVLAGLAR